MSWKNKWKDIEYNRYPDFILEGENFVFRLHHAKAKIGNATGYRLEGRRKDEVEFKPLGYFFAIVAMDEEAIDFSVDKLEWELVKIPERATKLLKDLGYLEE